MPRFYELYADVNWRDYGGKWYAHDTDAAKYGHKHVYHVVEFINWEDATGEPNGHKEHNLCFNPVSDRYESARAAYWRGDSDTLPDKAPHPLCRYIVSSGTFDLDDYTPEQKRRALDTIGWYDNHSPEFAAKPRDTVLLDAFIGCYGLDDDVLCGNNAHELLARAKARL